MSKCCSGKPLDIPIADFFNCTSYNVKGVSSLFFARINEMAWIIGVYIVNGLIWGFATNAVVKNRGYYENWFWWGFFFGFIALIVALTKPQVIQTSYQQASNSSSSALSRVANQYELERIHKDNEKILISGGWRCACGRVNASYVGFCGCGETKTSVLAKIESKKENEIKKQKEENELQNMRKLLEFKNLLDSGIISEEEYEKKKIELLVI